MYSRTTLNMPHDGDTCSHPCSGKLSRALVSQCRRENRAKAIPKGAWRLQLLSDRPLLPLSQSPDEGGGGSDPSPSPASPRGGAAGDPGEAEGGESTTVVPCLERVVYGGDYVPNKYSRLFRWDKARIRHSQSEKLDTPTASCSSPAMRKTSLDRSAWCELGRRQ